MGIHEDVGELMQFFFKGMSRRWIAGAPKITIDELPGAKAITFEEGELRLVDAYWVNGRNSFGLTVIWRNVVPVWHMQCHGWYEERAIPVVNEALRRAYNRERFEGGRGTSDTTNEDGSLRYMNDPDWLFWEFPKFHGSEGVQDRSGDLRLIGNYEYSGGLLIS